MPRLVLTLVLLALLLPAVSGAAAGPPPQIAITSPTSTTTLDASQTIKGVASSSSSVVTLVTLSDGSTLRPAGSGEARFPFEFSVVLHKGLNEYRVTAADAAGAKTTVVVAFYLERAEIALRVGVQGHGTVVGSGIGCPSVCQEDAYLGDHLKLQAKPRAGFRFVKWLGSCRATRGPVCRLEVVGDVETTAVFRRSV